MEYGVLQISLEMIAYTYTVVRADGRIAGHF